jgi:uncharacterized protein YciI
MSEWDGPYSERREDSMHYLLFYTFVENIVERRAPFREEHLRLATESHERGELLMAGAVGDATDSAVLVFRADDPGVVETFARSDPYVINDLVPEWVVRPWHVAIGG